MNGVNLLPQHRRTAKARKARMTKWVLGLGTYACLLLVGYMASVRYVGADSRPLTLESRELASRLASTSKTATALAGELTTVQQKLRTAQSIGQQPDWSRLLALLSQTTNENVVLEMCRLRRSVKAEATSSKPPAAAGGAAAAGAVKEDDVQLILELDGLAKAQADVSEYVLSLEKLALFEKVKLVKTGSKDFLTNKATTFSLECTFRTHEGQTP